MAASAEAGGTGQGREAMAWVYDLTIQGGLLLLMVVTPLAFGSVYPWGIALMQGRPLARL